MPDDLSPAVAARAVETNINAQLRLLYAQMPGVEVIDELGLLAMMVGWPTLMIVDTQDGQYRENALIFGHLGTSDKAFMPFVGPGYMMVYDPEMVARKAHFAVAFFATISRDAKTWPGTFQRSSWSSTMTWLGVCTRTSIECQPQTRLLRKNRR
jgi:hypothetical protein